MSSGEGVSMKSVKNPQNRRKILPCMFNNIPYSDSHLLSPVIVEAPSSPFSTFALSIRQILKWLPTAAQFHWLRENDYATIFSFNKMRSGRTAILRPITVFIGFKFFGKVEKAPSSFYFVIFSLISGLNMFQKLDFKHLI